MQASNSPTFSICHIHLQVRIDAVLDPAALLVVALARLVQ